MVYMVNLNKTQKGKCKTGILYVETLNFWGKM